MSTWSRQKYSYSHFSTSPHSLKCSYSPTPHAFDTPNSREDCSEERDFIILSNGTERMCFSRRLPLSLFSYQVPPRWRDPSKRNVHLPVSSKAAGLLPVPSKWGHCCCSLLSCSRGASYQAEANEINHQCSWINEALGVLLASLIAQLVKNLFAMQEPPVQFLGLEDPLEKG